MENAVGASAVNVPANKHSRNYATLL